MASISYAVRTRPIIRNGYGENSDNGGGENNTEDTALHAVYAIRDKL